MKEIKNAGHSTYSKLLNVSKSRNGQFVVCTDNKRNFKISYAKDKFNY
jgi:hypothetical protein